MVVVVFTTKTILLPDPVFQASQDVIVSTTKTKSLNQGYCSNRKSSASGGGSFYN